MNSNVDHEEKPLKDTALLVIDMQTSFLQLMPDPDTLRRRVRFAIAASQLLGARVYFTEQVTDKLGSTERAMMEGLDEPAAVYPKTAFSALRADGLIHDLQNNNVRHLFLSGLELPICVYQTALDAMAHEDWAITILTDCVSGRCFGDQQSVLAALCHANCFALPCESVFYAALGDAKHPLFREFNQLVRQYTSA